MPEINDVEFMKRCPNGCGETLYATEITDYFPLFSRAENIRIEIQDLPVLKCDECDDYFIPDSSQKRLEEIADEINTSPINLEPTDQPIHA